MAVREESVEVRLGDETYTVVPQPHVRVQRTFPKVLRETFGNVGELDTSDVQSIVGGLGDGVYDVLKVFIDDLMPRYKFMGFPTQQAMEADEYDDEYADNAPTYPQILDAFEAIYRINGGARIQQGLGKALGPEILGAARAMAASWLSRMLQNSQPPSGESDSTSSGETDRTGPVSLSV